MLCDFYKNDENDQIWWAQDIEDIGVSIFTFDKITLFNLFRDYPYKLSKEQKEIFDKENPYWRDFFRDRQ